MLPFMAVWHEMNLLLKPSTDKPPLTEQVDIQALRLPSTKPQGGGLKGKANEEKR
jgi:hypothetical protein